MKNLFEGNWMSWVQRYIDNVRTYLPAQLREDVGNELYSDLQDQCDELSDSLGRPLTDEEVLTLIAKKGHPMVVAAGYQSRRSLVSEPLFPVYLQVLKLVIAVIAVVSAIDVIAALYFEVKVNFVRAAVSWFAGVYEGAIHAFAWVTLVFFLAGGKLGYGKVLENWNPRALPKVAHGGRRIQRFDSAVEFAVTLLAMTWVNDIWRLPMAEGGLTFSPAFEAALPWLNIALGLSVVMSLIKLVSPYWTLPRLYADIALNICWLGLLVVLMSIYPPFSLVWQGGEVWQPSAGGWRAGVGIVIAITGWDLLQNLRVLLRQRAESAGR